MKLFGCDNSEAWVRIGLKPFLVLLISGGARSRDDRRSREGLSVPAGELRGPGVPAAGVRVAAADPPRERSRDRGLRAGGGRRVQQPLHRQRGGLRQEHHVDIGPTPLQRWLLLQRMLPEVGLTCWFWCYSLIAPTPHVRT